MNKDTARDYLPLVQALAEGKVIQYKYQKSDKSYSWMDLESCVDFFMPAEFYRIKPEPREHWSNRYADGYETSACFLSKSQAENAAHRKNAKQICYREVIE